MFKNFFNNINKYYKYLIKENKSDKKLLYGINPKYKNQENLLLELFGKCNNFNKEIKLVVISDTHGCLKETEFSEFILQHQKFDICLLLGDHSIGDI